MPLTYADPISLRSKEVGEVTERQARARKVSPQYGEGELVKVGWARNQPEAELIAGMLLEEGIPSMSKRSRGFDVPDFLAGGPRDILVAQSGADHARDVLDATEDAHHAQREPTAAWVRALALFLVVVTISLVLAGVVSALIS
ncbi:MAG: hypothetical protein WKF94_06330 [Solirubrobacteraceae bacterium]